MGRPATLVVFIVVVVRTTATATATTAVSDVFGFVIAIGKPDFLLQTVTPRHGRPPGIGLLSVVSAPYNTHLVRGLAENVKAGRGRSGASVAGRERLRHGP